MYVFKDACMKDKDRDELSVVFNYCTSVIHTTKTTEQPHIHTIKIHIHPIHDNIILFVYNTYIHTYATNRDNKEGVEITVAHHMENNMKTLTLHLDETLCSFTDTHIHMHNSKNTLTTRLNSNSAKLV